MQPINYLSMVPQQDFLRDVHGGLQIGMSIRAAQQAQQQQEAAQQRQQQYQQAVQSYLQAPTGSGASALTLQFPERAKEIQDAWGMEDKVQRDSTLKAAVPFFAALNNGRPDVAKGMLEQRVAALQNSGQDSSHEEQWLQQLNNGQADVVKGQMGLFLSAVHPDFAKNFGELGAESRAAALAPSVQEKSVADARKAGAEATTAQVTAANAPKVAAQAAEESRWKLADLKSQIEDRAARRFLDTDKLTTDTQIRLKELGQKFGELPESVTKMLNDSVLSSTSSEQQTSQYHQLASQIDALGASWGTATSVNEWLKRATGNEDAVSALRREYTRMASQGVIKLMPPGPASDQDVKNAKEGIPNANASPQVVASYLRGMAKLSAYDAALNSAKAEWLGQVRNLGKARSDIEIDGVKVPAGMSFDDFARKSLARKADQINSAATVSTRGYMKYAAPTGATGAY